VAIAVTMTSSREFRRSAATSPRPIPRGTAQAAASSASSAETGSSPRTTSSTEVVRSTSDGPNRKVKTCFT